MPFHIVALLLESFLFVSSVAWDYQHNGADWTALGQCGSGHSQSPIDVPISTTKTTKSDDHKVFLKYPEIGFPFQFYNNGHSLAFTLPDTYKGGFGLGKDVDEFKKDEKDGASAYRLWQVNFHSPSEHSFEGTKMPLEMQLMHQRVTGGGPETAVISVFFTDGGNTYNDFLDAFARNLPESAWGEETVDLPAIPFASIVGGSPFYHYMGSLTAPPCEMGVKYYLRQTPLTAANAQLTKFAAALTKTSPPKGNFRIAQPVSDPSSVVLVPSVDLISNPDAVVKPKISAADKMSAKPVDTEKLPAPPATEEGCSKDEYDEQYQKMGRIAVGDPDYVVKAKEEFLRAKRNVQAADGAYRSASRNMETQNGLYDSAPGWVEKIHTKWGVDNAKVLQGNAKVNKDSLTGSLNEPWQNLVAALNRMCNERRGNQTQVEQKAAITTPAPLAKPKEDTPPWVYPEPKVKLPRGLAASPFTDGSASKTAGSSAGGLKIAANLHQADVPQSAKKKTAPDQAPSAESLKPYSEHLLKITLPIDQQSITDKGKFKQDLLDTLAKKAGVLPTDMSVKRIVDSSIASVEVSAPKLFQLSLQSKRKFLRSDGA